MKREKMPQVILHIALAVAAVILSLLLNGGAGTEEKTTDARSRIQQESIVQGGFGGF
ncbi:MAG: hypothetical protein NC419_13345 [Muribaculaceae bacterium]|nr:hypothetical protein [Muribaculaceae bacterium]